MLVSDDADSDDDQFHYEPDPLYDADADNNDEKWMRKKHGLCCSLAPCFSWLSYVVMRRSRQRVAHGCHLVLPCMLHASVS